MEVLLPGLYHHIVVIGNEYSKVLARQHIRYRILMMYLSESKDLRKEEYFSVHTSGKFWSFVPISWLLFERHARCSSCFIFKLEYDAILEFFMIWGTGALILWLLHRIQ